MVLKFPEHPEWMITSELGLRLVPLLVRMSVLKNCFMAILLVCCPMVTEKANSSATPDLEKVWMGWSKIQREVVMTRVFVGCICRVAGNTGPVFDGDQGRTEPISSL